MNAVIQAAQVAARKAQESTYDGVATVVEYQKVKDEESKLVSDQEVVTLEDEPCRLSFSSIVPVAQSKSVASVAQTVKLFISPDVQIKPGSKISVTQCGVTTDYTFSSAPAIYPTHQEIVLDLFEDWA